MSEARLQNMLLIAKGADELTDLEETNEETPSVAEQIQEEKLKQSQLQTQAAINRLEEAKRKAKSDAVKAKLQEEIEATKARKDAAAEAQKTQLTEAAKQTQTVKDTANVIRAGGIVAGDAKQVIDGTVGKVQETAGNIAGTLATVSTPGTIWLPVTILIIFFFLIIPVGGQTRMQWLWDAVTGNAKIGATGGGAVGGFGGEEQPVYTLPVVGEPYG